MHVLGRYKNPRRVNYWTLVGGGGTGGNLAIPRFANTHKDRRQVRLSVWFIWSIWSVLLPDRKSGDILNFRHEPHPSPFRSTWPGSNSSGLSSLSGLFGFAHKRKKTDYTDKIIWPSCVSRISSFIKRRSSACRMPVFPLPSNLCRMPQRSFLSSSTTPSTAHNEST